MALRHQEMAETAKAREMATEANNLIANVTIDELKEEIAQLFNELSQQQG